MSTDHNHALYLPIRPRRNRATQAIRSLVRETHLQPSNFILPLFIKEADDGDQAIPSMPGQERLTPSSLIKKAKEAYTLGIRALALFPVINNEKKDHTASEGLNPSGLLQRSIQAIKSAVPDITIITDVAMDPYSSDGHDGLVEDSKINNDKTLDILANMAIVQARAGADIIAPSDMMDGRIGIIRQALDDEAFTDTGILAYSAKYASAFYGPFRDALDSAPRNSSEIPGDKKTYQMDPANTREALREVLLDVYEGADMVMVKPAGPYLDIISSLKPHLDIPLAAYQVSGEYAMIKAAAANGWLQEEAVILESLTAIKRAGAGIILTYFALDAARLLAS